MYDLKAVEMVSDEELYKGELYAQAHYRLWPS